jgi:hypothetical protein
MADEDGKTAEPKPGKWKIHPNSLANLKPAWKPGQTGNPRKVQGRAKLTTILRGVLGQEVTREEIERWLGPKAATEFFGPVGTTLPEGVDPPTWADLLVRSAITQAMAGNAAILKEIWARMDGPVPVEIQGPQGGPVALTAGFEAALARIYGDKADAPESGGVVLDVTPTDALPGPAESDGDGG